MLATFFRFEKKLTGRNEQGAESQGKHVGISVKLPLPALPHAFRIHLIIIRVTWGKASPYLFLPVFSITKKTLGAFSGVIACPLPQRSLA